MRVIQDSEDEDDLELIEAGEDAPVEDRNGQERGTGSTESLKRKIEDAHRTQFRSLTDATASHQDAPHSNTLDKRRKTSLDPSPVSSLLLESAKQYVSPSNQILGNTCNLSEIERRVAPTIALPAVLSPEKLWNLDGTIHEEWQYHEPGMFVEPSSTVPNATATQQRILQENLAPAFPGLDPTVDGQYQPPPKSSVPWSEFMRSSSSREPQDESGNTSQNDQRSTQHRKYPETNPPMSPIQELRNSEQPEDIIMSSKQEQKEIAIRQSPRQQRTSQAEPTSSTKSRPLSGSTKDPPEESAFDNSASIELSTEQYVPRPSRSRSSKLSLDAPIDYSVRPEKMARRTRTSGATESGSGATTPEKVRQITEMGFTPKTTQRALKRHHGDMASSVEWLIASGEADEDELAPPRSSRSKKAKRNEAEQARFEVERQEASAVTQEETNADSKIRGKPLSAGIDPDDSPASRTKTPRVQVVIPPKPRELEAELESTVNPTNHNDVETPKQNRRKIATEPQEASNGVVATPAKEKKKRGRPRKDAKRNPVEEKQIDEPASDSGPKSKALQQAEPNVQNVSGELETSEKQSSPVLTKQTTATVERAAPSEKASPRVIDNGEPPKDSSEQPSDKAVAVPRKPLGVVESAQSPQTNGKRTYRVGLSKRARIAPLLRVVKK
ncbi:unnamed protein product [Periconia digitata]|uniref:UBA domain-containing protein n=1 Tax=Periconia digitata TaxID=1303443 RepID=A0A9W4XPS8_9PLEO|nr:unnamed protein product [Periconia digitata]